MIIIQRILLRLKQGYLQAMRNIVWLVLILPACTIRSEMVLDQKDGPLYPWPGGYVEIPYNSIPDIDSKSYEDCVADSGRFMCWAEHYQFYILLLCSKADWLYLCFASFDLLYTASLKTVAGVG